MRYSRPLSKDTFRQRFLPLLTANVLRAKGLLWFDESKDRRVLFQFAAQRYSFEELPLVPGVAPDSQLVVIGHALDRTVFEALALEIS